MQMSSAGLRPVLQQSGMGNVLTEGMAEIFRVCSLFVTFKPKAACPSQRSLMLKQLKLHLRLTKSPVDQPRGETPRLVMSSRSV